MIAPGSILIENTPGSHGRQLVVIATREGVVVARDSFGREALISTFLIHTDERPRAFGYSLLRRDRGEEAA